MNVIAALLYAVATSVLLALGLGFQNDHIDRHAAMLALSGGAIVGILGWVKGRKHQAACIKPRGWEWVPVILFMLFALRAFLWLIFTNEDEVRVLSPNNLGDMSLHLTLINYFANGAPLWPDSPIFSQGKLTYAIGMDLFNSLLVLAGVELHQSLIVVGLIGAIFSGFALWHWGGAFALAGFLFSGGLLGFGAFIAAPGELFFRDYPGNLVWDWAWKNLALALLVTQRGFLFALPAGLLLLASWRARLFGAGNRWHLPWLGELLLYAAMPVFHLHTFLALSLLLATFFIVHAASRKKLLALVGAAFVPATILVWLCAGMLQSNALPMWEHMGDFDNPPPRPASTMLGWQPGWMANEPEIQAAWQPLANASPLADALAPWGKFLFFWIGNFSLWPFLSAALLLPILRGVLRKSIPTTHAWIAGLAFVLITPWLGTRPGYDSLTFADFLLGSGSNTLKAFVLGIIGIGSAIGGLLLLRWSGEKSAIRWLLYSIAAVCAVDGLLLILHITNSRFPQLRADAVPFILASALFLLLLLKLAKVWQPLLWPAAFVLPALFLFFACCNIRFAPWAWDNTKLMLWAYVIILPFIWDYVIERWPLWGRAIVLFLLFCPGFITLIGGINSQYRGYPIARETTLLQVAGATRSLPITATFAGAPTWNHPLLLCGRKMPLGSLGHLYSHGIHTADTESRLHALMNGSDDWRLQAARLGIRYLFWSTLEADQWPNSTQVWRADATVIASGAWGEILDLDLPPLPLED